MTLIYFLLSHSFVTLAVFFGSLSCMKTHPGPIFNVFAHCPSLPWSHPVSSARKQPQNIMFPPPCLTLGMVFFESFLHFFILQTRQVGLMPNGSTLFYLTKTLSSPSLHWVSEIFTVKLKASLYMCLLEQGDFKGTARFPSITAECVTNCFLDNWGCPVAFRPLKSPAV